MESVSHSGLPPRTSFLLFLLLSFLLPGITRWDQAVSLTPRDKGSYLLQLVPLEKSKSEIRDALEAVVLFPAGRLSKKRFLPKVSVEPDTAPNPPAPLPSPPNNPLPEAHLQPGVPSATAGPILIQRDFLQAAGRNATHPTDCKSADGVRGGGGFGWWVEVMGVLNLQRLSLAVPLTTLLSGREASDGKPCGHSGKHHQFLLGSAPLWPSQPLAPSSILPWRSYTDEPRSAS